MATMATIQDHTDVLSRLEPGDQVEFKRVGYSHWAVYIGNGDVIHLASVSGQSFDKTKTAVVRQDRIQDVAENGKIIINNSKGVRHGIKAFSRPEIVERAKRLLGLEGYNLIAMNCEHFVSWCCYNIGISDQVTDRIELTVKAAKLVFTLLLGKRK